MRLFDQRPRIPKAPAISTPSGATETPLRPGQDYCVLDVQGKGHYVGCVLTFSTVHRDSPYEPDVVRGHLEGDARFYTDGNRTPLVACTGTEEYFNWGWYDVPKHDQVFSYPTHGYPCMCLSARIIAPCSGSMSAKLRHSTVLSGLTWSMALLAGPRPILRHGLLLPPQPALLLMLTDELDIGDNASESAHDYKAKGELEETRHTIPYEGSHQLALTEDAPRDREYTYKDTGRTWKKSVKFTVTIAPNNKGVLLRRRSYYGFGADGDLCGPRPTPLLTETQRVRVKVDGVAVGDWYVPAGHARDAWRDTDFEIPAAATQGKTSITIKLSAQDDTHWDEYTYWVFAYTE